MKEKREEREGEIGGCVTFRKGQNKGNKISLHLLIISPIVCLFRSICRINKKPKLPDIVKPSILVFCLFVCLFLYLKYWKVHSVFLFHQNC